MDYQQELAEIVHKQWCDQTEDFIIILEKLKSKLFENNIQESINEIDLTIKEFTKLIVTYDELDDDIKKERLKSTVIIIKLIGCKLLIANNL